VQRECQIYTESTTPSRIHAIEYICNTTGDTKAYAGFRSARSNMLMSEYFQLLDPAEKGIPKLYAQFQTFDS